MGEGRHMMTILMIMTNILIMAMMNNKKVGNYGGGGAVQKLHPRKAPTLAIIKVINKAIIFVTDAILIPHAYDAGIERGFVDRPRHKVDHHRLHPLQRQHQHVLHCQGPPHSQTDYSYL